MATDDDILLHSELSFRSNPDVLTFPGDDRKHGHEIVTGIAGKMTNEYAEQAVDLHIRVKRVSDPMEVVDPIIGIGANIDDYLTRVRDVSDAVYTESRDVHPFRIAADHASTVWPWAEYLKAVGNTVQLYRQMGETVDEDYCKDLKESSAAILSNEKDGSDAMQNINSMIVATMSVILGFDRTKGFEGIEAIFKSLAELSPQTALEEATVQIALLIAQGRTDLERSERTRKEAEQAQLKAEGERDVLLDRYTKLREQAIVMVHAADGIRRVTTDWLVKKDYDRLANADIMTRDTSDSFVWAAGIGVTSTPMDVDRKWTSLSGNPPAEKTKALLVRELDDPRTFDSGFIDVISSYVTPTIAIMEDMARERSVIIRGAEVIANLNKDALKRAMEAFVVGPDGIPAEDNRLTRIRYTDYIDKFRKGDTTMELADNPEPIMLTDTLGTRVTKIQSALEYLTKGLLRPVRENALADCVDTREAMIKAAEEERDAQTQVAQDTRMTLQNQLKRWGDAFASRSVETTSPMAQLQKRLDVMIGSTAQEIQDTEAKKQSKRSRQTKGKEKEGEEEGEIQDRGFNKFGNVVDEVDDKMKIVDPTVEDLTGRLDLLLDGLQASFVDVNKLLKETNDYYTTTFRIVVEKYARDLGDIGPDLKVLDRGLAERADKFQTDWNVAKHVPSLKGKMEIIGDAAEIYKRAYESCTAVITKKIAPEMDKIRARIETGLQAAAKGLALVLHGSSSRERQHLLRYARLMNTDRANVNVVRSMTTSTAHVRDLVVSGQNQLVGDVAEKSLQNLTTLIIYLTTMMEDMARVVKRSTQTKVVVKKEAGFDEADRLISQVLAYVSSLKAGTEGTIESAWRGYDAVAVKNLKVEGNLEGYEDAAQLVFSVTDRQSACVHAWLKEVRRVAGNELATEELVRNTVGRANDALFDVRPMQQTTLSQIHGLGTLVFPDDKDREERSRDMAEAIIVRLKQTYGEIWTDVEHAQSVVADFYGSRFKISIGDVKFEPIDVGLTSVPKFSIRLPKPDLVMSIEPRVVPITREKLDELNATIERTGAELDECLKAEQKKKETRTARRRREELEAREVRKHEAKRRGLRDTMEAMENNARRLSDVNVVRHAEDARAMGLLKIPKTGKPSTAFRSSVATTTLGDLLKRDEPLFRNLETVYTETVVEAMERGQLTQEVVEELTGGKGDNVVKLARVARILAQAEVPVRLWHDPQTKRPLTDARAGSIIEDILAVGNQYVLKASSLTPEDAGIRASVQSALIDKRWKEASEDAMKEVTTALYWILKHTYLDPSELQKVVGDARTKYVFPLPSGIGEDDLVVGLVTYVSVFKANDVTPIFEDPKDEYVDIVRAADLYPTVITTGKDKQKDLVESAEATNETATRMEETQLRLLNEAFGPDMTEQTLTSYLIENFLPTTEDGSTDAIRDTLMDALYPEDTEESSSFQAVLEERWADLDGKANKDGQVEHFEMSAALRAYAEVAAQEMVKLSRDPEKIDPMKQRVASVVAVQTLKREQGQKEAAIGRILTDVVEPRTGMCRKRQKLRSLRITMEQVEAVEKLKKDSEAYKKTTREWARKFSAEKGEFVKPVYDKMEIFAKMFKESMIRHGDHVAAMTRDIWTKATAAISIGEFRVSWSSVIKQLIDLSLDQSVKPILKTEELGFEQTFRELGLSIEEKMVGQSIGAKEEDIKGEPTERKPEARPPSVSRQKYPPASVIVGKRLAAKKQPPVVVPEDPPEDPRPPTKTIPKMSVIPSETDAFGFL